jgi:hypothetical protein
MATSEKHIRRATGATSGRYPRGEFDACYWRLADLCELAVALPPEQELRILEAFDQLAEIGTPRHLQLVGIGDSYAAQRQGNLAAGHSPASHTAAAGSMASPTAALVAGESDGPTVAGEAEADEVAVEVLRRAARLAVRAGSLEQALAWDRVRELLTAAFPDVCAEDCGGPGTVA